MMALFFYPDQRFFLTAYYVHHQRNTFVMLKPTTILLAKLICNYCPPPFLYLLFEESRINSVVVTKVGKVASAFGSNYYVLVGKMLSSLTANPSIGPSNPY